MLTPKLAAPDKRSGMGHGAVTGPSWRSALEGSARRRGPAARGGYLLALALGVCAVAAGAPSGVRADEEGGAIPAYDTAVLIRLLDGAHSFRVRARAALALGSRGG